MAALTCGVPSGALGEQAAASGKPEEATGLFEEDLDLLLGNGPGGGFYPGPENDFDLDDDDDDVDLAAICTWLEASPASSAPSSDSAFSEILLEGTSKKKRSAEGVWGEGSLGMRDGGGRGTGKKARKKNTRKTNQAKRGSPSPPASPSSTPCRQADGSSLPSIAVEGGPHPGGGGELTPPIGRLDSLGTVPGDPHCPMWSDEEVGVSTLSTPPADGSWLAHLQFSLSSSDTENNDATAGVGKREEATDAGQNAWECEESGEDAKKKIRLKRNRASAALSRQRKRAELDNLRQRCRELEKANAHLHYIAQCAQTENLRLRAIGAAGTNGATCETRMGALPPAHHARVTVPMPVMYVPLMPHHQQWQDQQPPQLQRQPPQGTSARNMRTKTNTKRSRDGTGTCVDFVKDDTPTTTSLETADDKTTSTNSTTSTDDATEPAVLEQTRPAAGCDTQSTSTAACAVHTIMPNILESHRIHRWERRCARRRGRPGPGLPRRSSIHIECHSIAMQMDVLAWSPRRSVAQVEAACAHSAAPRRATAFEEDADAPSADRPTWHSRSTDGAALTLSWGKELARKSGLVQVEMVLDVYGMQMISLMTSRSSAIVLSRGHERSVLLFVINEVTWVELVGFVRFISASFKEFFI